MSAGESNTWTSPFDLPTLYPSGVTSQPGNAQEGMNSRDTIFRGDLLTASLTETQGRNAVWQSVGGSRNTSKYNIGQSPSSRVGTYLNPPPISMLCHFYIY